MRVLITGSSGFVGSAVVAKLAQLDKYELRTVGRKERAIVSDSIEHVVGDMTSNNGWINAVDGVDTIIHAAARAHVLEDSVTDSLAEYRKVNVAGTLNLAHQAVGAGVRRIIFISSIKVNGESTNLGKPYTANDVPAPADPYGISKYEAELGLTEIAEETGLEVVIIRPVLVYGPGVKANFHSMMHWLNKGIPLPFSAIHNKRSFVALDNLVDLITICIDHPAAVNQTFLISDGEDLSTTELLRRLSAALGKPGWLLPAPTELLKAGAILLGKRDIAQRLLESLQVDIDKTKQVLGWVPPVGIDEALKKTAMYFLKQNAD